MKIKDRNEVLKYIRKERQQRDENIKEEEWIRHFKKLLEGEEVGRRQAEEERNNREWKEETEEDKFTITEQEIKKAIN